MGKFKWGDRVEKKQGSAWHGTVCGKYSTALTPEGYAVESEREPGSVQIYPAEALNKIEGEAALIRKQSVYLVGSLRNDVIPKLGVRLREAGHTVFDDWHGAGPNADDEWQKYERQRGRSYLEALDGHAANNTFDFDHRNILTCDAGVLVLPAGKSAHLEIGYMIGMGKRGYVLYHEEPERWDLMYKFAHGVFVDQDALIEALGSVTHGVR